MINKLVDFKKTIGWFVPYIFTVCICGFIFFTDVSGLDRDRTISQFHHTSWTTKDGAPSQIRVIAQTNDGYLWLGCVTGLYRFDGITFDKYEPQSGGPFPSNNILSLLALPDGGLWIGYRYSGIGFLKDGILTNYGMNEGLPPGRVISFAKDDDGMIWAAGAFGLFRFEGSRWQQIGSDWNFTGKQAYSSLVDNKGTLWVSTEDTILFLSKGATSFQTTGVKAKIVWNLIQSPDGTIWMAEISRSVRPLTVPDFDPFEKGFELQVGSLAILFDREGALWSTSVGDGLRRVRFPDRFRGEKIAQFSNKAEIYTEKDGLSADYNNSIFEDREGNIWVGTANGLDRFRASSIVPVPFPPGYQNYGLAAGDQGKIWTASTNQYMTQISNDSVKVLGKTGAVNFLYSDNKGEILTWDELSIHRFSEGTYTKIATPPGSDILTIFKDRGGVLWTYQVPGGLLSLKDGVWMPYERQAELPDSKPITGIVDFSDRKWLAYPGNKVTVIEGENIRTFSQDDGLAVGDVKVIQARFKHVWAGGEFGLAVLAGDRFQMILAEATESFSGISGIVEMSEGDIWVNEARGVVHIPAEEIRLALENSDYKVRYRLFDFLDGLPGRPQQLSPHPTAIEGSDGRVWFATNGGVAWIDPKKIINDVAPPPVLIRSLNTGDNSYAAIPPLELPKGITSFRINYTALNLSMPERVRFRYRLAGIDEEWQEAGTRREAFYTNLGPGSYHFQVIAANNDGVWNETGASLTFTILPAFYQTLWFRLASLLIALLFVGVILRLIYNRRISQATEQLNTRFEERLMERNRISQELHDTLLQGFLGVTMRLQAISNTLPEKAKENLDNVLDQVDVVLEEGRRGIWDIKTSTVTENDLAQAFSLVGEELKEVYPANFSLTIEGESRPLHPLIRDEVYRIGREALINSFRHSKAAEIEAGIEYSRKYLRIFIRDNGCGINPDYLSSGRLGHLGLTGMREFANKIDAELKIWSFPESGTEVELIVPHHVAYIRKSSGIFKKLRDLYRHKESAP